MASVHDEPSASGFGAPPDATAGLTDAEATARLERDGPNDVVPTGTRPRWRRVLAPFTDPMVALLLVAAPTYLLIGDTADAIIAIVALLPIAGVGWALEWRAEHTLERLRSALDPTAVVWRDGRNTVVPAERLVVGDLVWLREGDIVPADVLLVGNTPLVVDESSLTGESLAVTASGDDAAVFAGTTVLSGRSIARVTPDRRHRTGRRQGSLEGVAAHAMADSGQREAIEEQHRRLADLGMRLIAVAGGETDEPATDRAGDEVHLRLLGLVAFDDPVRPGVSAALEQCRAAGLRVVMITGDHPATAHAVAEGLGLPHGSRGGAEAEGDRIATGADLDAAMTGPPDRLARLVAETNVFARTRPDQKHALVTALRAGGDVVAMTGDGINDAPALRAADIGIAMGERGTEVAREAATVVLLDDDFATIVTAIRGGRRIYDNLSRAFAYLIAFHPPLMLAALVVPLLDRPLLLLPVHLVLLELLLHPVVSLVFEADPADDDVMRRPLRPVGSALGMRALLRPWLLGITLAAGVIGLYLGALHRNWPTEQARALALATLFVAQVFLVIGERCPERPLWRHPPRPTRQLVWALGAISLVAVCAVEFGPLARLLQLAAFPWQAWLVVIGVAAVTTLWSEPWKRPLDRRVRRRTS